MSIYGSNPKSGLIRQHTTFINWLQQIIDISFSVSSLLILIYFRDGTIQESYILLSLLTALAMIIVYQWNGVYYRMRTGNIFQEAQVLFVSWMVVITILIVIAFVSKSSEIFSRKVAISWVISSFLLQLFVHASIRLYMRYLRMHDRNIRRAILVGEGAVAEDFVNRLNELPWMGIKLIGCISVEKSKGSKLFTQKTNIPVIGSIIDLESVISKVNADIIYITLPVSKTHLIEKIMKKSAALNLDIHWVPDIVSFQLINHGIREIGGLPVLCLSDSPLSGLNHYIKEWEDRILSCIILFLISPLLILIAILIKLTSPGPIFFMQPRDGLNGKKILVYKFRTMHHSKDPEDSSKPTIKNDPRVTKLGLFLRRTSLDELPQFINVLEGKMSIVGPRPHATFTNQEYKDKVESYMFRHRIKPGITGWAQVNGWRGETDTLEKMEMRIKYDLYYINNWSLWFDFKIIIMSIFKGFTGKNAY